MSRPSQRASLNSWQAAATTLLCARADAASAGLALGWVGACVDGEGGGGIQNGLDHTLSCTHSVLGWVVVVVCRVPQVHASCGWATAEHNGTKGGGWGGSGDMLTEEY